MVAVGRNLDTENTMGDMTARNERLGKECEELTEKNKALRYQLALHELRSNEWDLIVRTNDALLTHTETTNEEVKLLRALYVAVRRCGGVTIILDADVADAVVNAMDAVADFDVTSKAE